MAFAALAAAVSLGGAAVASVRPAPGTAPVVVQDDGGWCWFQDERVVVAGNLLLAGTVAAGVDDPERQGHVELTAYDLRTGRKQRLTLSRTVIDRWGPYDDHNAPGLAVLDDRTVLAVWAGHGAEPAFYSSHVERRGSAWSLTQERAFSPSPQARITYSNPLRLRGENAPTGRIYDFFRGLDGGASPSYAWSDDAGLTWQPGHVVLRVPGAPRHRPYVKYASNGEDTIHLVYTEGHPRDFDNSVYHVYYRRDHLHRSDGTPIRSLAEGLQSPAEGTRIFAGDAEHVAWVSDIALDRGGRPRVVYSVQVGSGGSGQDHRYRYARWDGEDWSDAEIAYAGTRLYRGEDDYTGNIALDPLDPAQVFISTNADPQTGEPLISAADGLRHWEIFRGRSIDGGATWAWEAITADSDVDNLRPVVPAWNSRRIALLWLRGTYQRYTLYDLDLVLQILERVGRPRAASAR